MSPANQPPPKAPFKHSTSTAAPTPSFLQQRDALVGEIAVAMEHVLQNINKLNRSLEGVIAVGNEFGAVEALWSQFENVMAKGSGHGEEGEAEGNNAAEEEEVEEDRAGRGDGKEAEKEKQRRTEVSRDWVP
ncbi:MAG: hypothetical protein Q9188_001434 [Gyalolechia gomerana]